jgi:MFS family permease
VPRAPLVEVTRRTHPVHLGPHPAAKVARSFVGRCSRSEHAQLPLPAERAVPGWSIAILLYAGHNAAAMLASLAAGHAIDRFSPRLVFGTGAGVYVLAYATFAWEQHAWPILLAAFMLAGVGIGCAETAESTMVVLALPDRLRGNGYGVLGLVQSVGDLGASVVAGLIWALISPTAAFCYTAAWMAAALLTAGWARVRPPRSTAPKKGHS